MKRFVCFVVLVFLCGGVVGVSGVVPGSYEIDFEGEYRGEFVFEFVLDGEADLYVEGDLAEFVSLDKESVSGRESVVVVLSLPSVIESPGVNSIKVGVREGGVDVSGVVKVVVPYPERYVGLDLNAPNVNVGEVVDINLGMSNLGRQVVNVEPRIEIYKMVSGEWSMVDDGVIGVFEGEGGILGLPGFLDFNVSFDSLNYSAGDYVAVALVDYGYGVVRAENIFRLGEFNVRVLDYSDEFVEGEVGRFEVEVESLWDGNMKEVYAEVMVIDSGVSFDSSIVKLGGWEKKVLVGAFDASGFSEGEVDAKIVLHYDGGVSSEDVVFRIVGEERSFFYFYVVGVLVLLVGLVWVLFRKKVNE